MNKPLKYLGYSVVFQEVPDEVTLAINISGCPYKCVDCHSKYLWDYKGNYIVNDIVDLLKKYDGLITCVCFMGGDQNPTDVLYCFNIIKQHNLKTCLYSGAENITQLSTLGITSYCDYVKVGRYNHLLGGLNSKTTNQKMFKKNDEYWDDITYKFWKEEK